MKVCFDKEKINSFSNDNELCRYIKSKIKEFESGVEENDKCVICGKSTPYKISTHINERIGYVEGAGQGCYMPNECSVF